MTKVERKLVICAKKRCMRCPTHQYHVAEDCEWTMKHLLDTTAQGCVIDMPRRSGKSFDIKRRDRDLSKLGVMILVSDIQSAIMMQQELMGTGIEISSIGGWGVTESECRSRLVKILTGKPYLAIFSDECKPWIADIINDMRQHRFILGYWTSNG